MELTPEIKNQFIDLSCQLSPETLTCDGELSKAECHRRYNELMRQWRLLERKVGRPVDEDEVFQWSIAENKI